MIVEIENWLRTSILGIILSGAIGSIFALILLKIFDILKNALIALFTRILPSQAKKFIAWYQQLIISVIRKVWYSFGYEFGRVSVGNPRGEVAYFALQLSRLIGWFTICVITAFIAITLLNQKSTLVLTTGAYLFIVLSMLSGVWAWKHIIAISSAAQSIADEIVKSSHNSKKKEEE